MPVFGWGRNKYEKITKDVSDLQSRVTILEEEMLPLIKSIDKRTASLENHMSHIVAEAFGKTRREEARKEV